MSLGLVLGVVSSFAIVSASNELHSCHPVEDLDPPVRAQAMMQNIQDWKIPEVFKRNEITSLQIFTQEDLAIVATLLKRGCCEESVLKEETCNSATQGPNYQAQSAYLTDHLMMVGMTKLDGDTEICETIGLEGCDMADPVLDVEPVERREKIREIAQSTDWYSSKQILELFKLYWWDSQVYAPENNKKWFLPHAYMRLCAEVTMIGTISWLSSAELEINKNCIRAVQYRIEQENQYVETLMVEKWAQFVWNMMRDYLQKYFADQRLSWLVTKYWVLDACWRMVRRTVEKTDCCNE